MFFIFLRYFIHHINDSTQAGTEHLSHLNSKSLEFLKLKHATHISITPVPQFQHYSSTLAGNLLSMQPAVISLQKKSAHQ